MNAIVQQGPRPAVDRGRRIWLAGLAAGACVAPLAAWAGGHDVSANEDLMREHGIIRRILLVYAEAARRLHRDAHAVPLPALGEAARLMREFGEDYHERLLEEAHVFPLMRKAKGAIAHLPDVLQKQHERGREITAYVRRVCGSRKLRASQAGPLARSLQAFVQMYAAHAAREDTELFPAWKSELGQRAYDEMGERFEEIERQAFGGDGFALARQRIERIEASFGLSDLARLTAPAPAAAKR